MLAPASKSSALGAPGIERGPEPQTTRSILGVAMMAPGGVECRIDNISPRCNRLFNLKLVSKLWPSAVRSFETQRDLLQAAVDETMSKRHAALVKATLVVVNRAAIRLKTPY